MICECSCDMDGDNPELIEDTYPIARKPYICCECREEIPRPSEYIEDIPLLDKNLDKEILDTFKSSEERSQKRSRSHEELDEESEGSQESLLKFSKSGEPTQFQFAQNPWDSESPPSYFSLQDEGR